MRVRAIETKLKPTTTMTNIPVLILECIKVHHHGRLVQGRLKVRSNVLCPIFPKRTMRQTSRPPHFQTCSNGMGGDGGMRQASAMREVMKRYGWHAHDTGRLSVVNKGAPM